MKDYYGTKRVTAERYDRTGWEMCQANPASSIYNPVGDAREHLGYKVTYADGYTSWSPKDVFEASYMPVDAMDFGRALQAMRDGHKVRREGWGQSYLVLENGNIVKRPGAPFRYMGMEYVDLGGPPDNPDDLLATDWMIVE